MTITLGFSPCPNDTFIFDALVNKKIDTRGYHFQPVMEDVQTLNGWALENKLLMSKISYGVWPLLRDNYSLLDAGGALGKGVGPLLISKGNFDDADMDKALIAIPGKNTTAHLLFSLAYPKAANKRFMVFSEIEDAVLSGKVDCGVIIHENRFTYMDKGLTKIKDLGSYWEEKTNGPIPLGGIVIRKFIDKEIQTEINGLIRESVEYSMSTYPVLSSFVKEHAQEMSEDVMRKHIDLYVNNYSLSLGADGKKAVNELISIYEHSNGVQIGN